MKLFATRESVVTLIEKQKVRFAVLVKTNDYQSATQTTLDGKNMVCTVVTKLLGANGRCLRLLEQPRHVFAFLSFWNEIFQFFEKLSQLFFLSDSKDQTLMVLVDMKRVVFPTYTVSRQPVIPSPFLPDELGV